MSLSRHHRTDRTSRYCAGLLTVLVLSLAAGCSRHGKAAPQGGDERPPSKVNLQRNVELTQADQRAHVYYVDTVGVLEAEGQTELAAGVSGVVDEVLFREGDAVSQGTVLVKVDQERYLAAVKVAEANIQRAEAAINLAKDALRRSQQAGQGASAEEKAKATLNLSLGEAELASAKATALLARHNLDRSQVRPPYSGWINQRRVTPGTYLEEKTVIATMADLSKQRLVGWIPETAMPTVRELMQQQQARLKLNRTAVPAGAWFIGPWAGLAATKLAAKDLIPSGFDPEFTLLAYPDRTFQARIFYLSTVASPDTHMFECKAEVKTDDLDVVLRPGLTARIRVPLRSNQHACFIPEESVRASERGFIAFVPEQLTTRDGRLEWVARARTLEIGYRMPGWVEVRQGISPGERLVRRGAEALEDGTPLRLPEK